MKRPQRSPRILPSPLIATGFGLLLSCQDVVRSEPSPPPDSGNGQQNRPKYRSGFLKKAIRSSAISLKPSRSSYQHPTGPQTKRSRHGSTKFVALRPSKKTSGKRGSSRHGIISKQ